MVAVLRFNGRVRCVRVLLRQDADRLDAMERRQKDPQDLSG